MIKKLLKVRIQQHCLLVGSQCPKTLFHVLDSKKTDAEKAEEADAEMLAAIAARRMLASDLELAQGVQYTEPLKTTRVFLSYRILLLVLRIF